MTCLKKSSCFGILSDEEHENKTGLWEAN